eukprot:TRINITY_DN6749_c0_g1_i10.p1 TRINITY_DN6749_c0_g1~~TRINITY_DN6749_c0_g1_i10.p1  ORF type:complete len:134 (-),score=8.79 TRINITY_DN6749_c0_g1_i10:37-438(-)
MVDNHQIEDIASIYIPSWFPSCSFTQAMMRQDYRDDVGGVPSMSADIALTEEQFPLMDGRYSYYMGRGRQSVYSLLTALCFFFYKVNGESFLFVTKQIVWWISWARPQKRKVSRVDLLSAMQVGSIYICIYMF